MKRIFTLLSLILISTSAVLADDAFWEQHLKAQLTEAELDTHQNFAFTQTTTNAEDGTQISAFQPANDPKWQLLSVDDRTPTERELEKFSKDRQQASERRADDRFADLVAPGSVVLNAQNDETIQVSFTPYIKDMVDESAEFMRAEAWFDPMTYTLTALRIVSIAEFSPSFGVKIERMEMRFEFAPHLGQTLPKTYLFALRGKVAGVKKIDVESTITYANFELIEG